MAGGAVMATAAYGAILGGIIGILVGSTIDHYYETELTSIIAGVSAVIGGILGTSYGKKRQENNENDLDPSFTKGAYCFGETIISNASNLKNCLTGELAICFEATHGFSEIVTCMGDNDNNLT